MNNLKLWIIAVIVIFIAILCGISYKTGQRSVKPIVDTLIIAHRDTIMTKDTIYIKAKVNAPPDTNTAETTLSLPNNGRIKVGFQVPKPFGIPSGSFFYFPEIRLPDPDTALSVMHRTDTLNAGNGCLARTKDGMIGGGITLMLIIGYATYLFLK